MGFLAPTAHIFPSIIRAAMKGDDIAPFTEFFLACPQGHDTLCLFGFHKVKELYLGNTESLLWTFTFMIFKCGRCHEKYLLLLTYTGGVGFGKEKDFSLIPHPSQQLLKRLFIPHKRKKKKMSRSRFYGIPRAQSWSFAANDHRQGTSRLLFTRISVEEL